METPQKAKITKIFDESILEWFNVNLHRSEICHRNYHLDALGHVKSKLWNKSMQTNFKGRCFSIFLDQ